MLYTLISDLDPGPEIPRDFYRLLLTLESLAEPERPNQETTDQLNVFIQELLSDHSHLLIHP